MEKGIEIMAIIETFSQTNTLEVAAHLRLSTTIRRPSMSIECAQTQSTYVRFTIRLRETQEWCQKNEAKGAIQRWAVSYLRHSLGNFITRSSSMG